MQDSPKQGTGAMRLARLGIVVAALVLLYYGVMAGIRAYVTTQVEKSQGQPLPDFALQDLAGKTWSNKDLLGKTTVLNFFRSHCPNCLKERDVIWQLHRECDKKKVQVLGVMMDAVEGFAAEVTQATLTRMAYEHPILMANDAFVDAFHGSGWAHVTPITYISDTKGRILHALRGHQTLETLRTATQ